MLTILYTGCLSAFFTCLVMVLCHTHLGSVYSALSSLGILGIFAMSKAVRGSKVFEFIMMVLIFCALIIIVDYLWHFLFSNTIRTEVEWYLAAMCLGILTAGIGALHGPDAAAGT